MLVVECAKMALGEATHAPFARSECARKQWALKWVVPQAVV
jgi:hypothetical protein